VAVLAVFINQYLCMRSDLNDFDFRYPVVVRDVVERHLSRRASSAARDEQREATTMEVT